MPDREYPPYDGRVAEPCRQECMAVTCAPSWSDPYGCGSCCGCLGGCEMGRAEQLAEVDDARALARASTLKPVEEYL